MSYITDSFDDEIVRFLQEGGVGVLPTDTIYGLSCRALDEQAVERLHNLKKRDKKKPFIVLISNITQLNDLGIITTDAAPALRYWPGKLTIICETQKAPEWLHMGTSSLAVRQPDSAGLLKLIEKTGPLISTSANLQGVEPLTNTSQAVKYFGDKLEFYVNAGRLAAKPSTIVKPIFGELEIIRQGAVKIKKEDRHDAR